MPAQYRPIRAMLCAAWLVALTAASVMPAFAQHAFVLGGGGARGLAHGGALVALEQLGYDAELVVGTSMGAIVGAMYAAGMTPAEIRADIAAENWLVRFAAEAVAVGHARQPLRPALAVGLNRRRFYEGFVATTRVNLRLVELLFDAGVRAQNDFDRLPRRYRAIAADLATGAEVVLAAGDLPRAVRASMSVPGAFAPVLWDGRVLGDGGIANNLPVSVARELTTAPIIAVDVLRPRPELDERNPLDLGVRAVRLLIENARPDHVQPDILVLPRIGDSYAETRFPADASALLRAGSNAVLAQVAPAAPSAAGPAARAPGDPPARVVELRVEGSDGALARLVHGTMAPALGAYDPARIIRRTAALYSTGLFSAVWPRLEFDAEDVETATLVVDVVPTAGTTVFGGIRWDNDVGSGIWATLRQLLPAGEPLDLRATLLVDDLSRRGSAEAAIMSTRLPGLSWVAGAHIDEERIRTFEGADVTGTAAVRRAGAWSGAELHGPIRDWFVSLLARADHVRQPGADGWSYGPYLRLSPPPRPDRVIGVEPVVEWEARLGTVPYSRWHVRSGHALAVGRAGLAAFGHAHAATRGAPADALPAAFHDAAPWLPHGALRSRLLAGGGIDMNYPLVFDGYIRLRLRTIGSAAHAADAGAGGRQLVRQTKWLAGGEIGAVWPTAVGPVSVGAATGRGAGWRINAGIGSRF
jgi:predicted acylesterase/phospholipase RssA